MSMHDTSYAAAAFHPRFEGGKGTGSLTIGIGGVRFEGEGQSISLPFRGLEVRAGGAAQRLIFFAHGSYPDWSIYTADRTVLTHSRLVGDATTSVAIRRIRSEKRRGFTIGVVIFGLMIAALFGLVVLKDPLIRIVVRRVPPSVEQTLGEVGLRQILLTSEVVSDPRVTEPLQKLLSRLNSAAGSGHAFRLHVLADDSVNAFALPGGHVLLNTGLLLKAESGEEIAGVMAHEIAHVTERHSLQQIVSTIGVFALVQALFGDVSGIIAVAADGGARLLTMSFSRDAERDADARGLELLHAARIDPRGMLSFFGRLQEQEEGQAAAGARDALQILSTHPATAERISRLTAEVERMRAQTKYPPIDLDLAKVSAAIADDK